MFVYMSNPSFHVACDAKNRTEMSANPHHTTCETALFLLLDLMVPFPFLIVSRAHIEVCWDPNTVSPPTLPTNFSEL